MARRCQQHDSYAPSNEPPAKKNYDENIATSGFPKKPDGSPMIYRAAVKVGVIFEGSKNKKRAKEFVAFLLQDENLSRTSRARSAAGIR